MVCEFLMTFQQWRGVKADVDWRRVLALMIGAVVGLPLGLWGITRVGEDTARAIIAVYVLVMCVVMLRGWRITRPQGFAPHLGVGIFAGIANAVGMAGLPVASYFTAQGVAAGVFRGTLIAYFAALDLFSLPGDVGQRHHRVGHVQGGAGGLADHAGWASGRGGGISWRPTRRIFASLPLGCWPFWRR